MSDLGRVPALLTFGEDLAIARQRKLSISEALLQSARAHL